MSWEIKFPESYQHQPNMAARGPIGSLPPVEEARPKVETFLRGHWKDIIRTPVGDAVWPCFVPGATYNQLWDWDAFFMAMASSDEYLDVSKGSILNLLSGVLTSGQPPKRREMDGSFVYDSFPLPVHAQFVWMLYQRTEDAEWIRPWWETLASIRRWYDAETVNGEYYVWSEFRGNGLDNNPAVYGRPPKTSAGVDLAVWHWCENHCMAQLAFALGRDGAHYGAIADRLAEQIRIRFWDPCDEFFYAIDCSSDPSQTSQQQITWPVHLKFRNFAGLFPVIMGIASAEQATAVFNRLLAPDEFLSPAGIRSHSARDGVYNNVPMGNPSNWQGPVWALTTCLCSYALARYGRVNEAKEVAGRLISTFAADLEANGCIHEYYCGDTGQPLSKPGFLSWNLLAGRILNDLDDGLNPLLLN
jgi:putative isomerase